MKFELWFEHWNVWICSEGRFELFAPSPCSSITTSVSSEGLCDICRYWRGQSKTSSDGIGRTDIQTPARLLRNISVVVPGTVGVSGNKFTCYTTHTHRGCPHNATYIFFPSRGSRSEKRQRLYLKWLGALGWERVSRIFVGSSSGGDKTPLRFPPPRLRQDLQYYWSQISISPAHRLENTWGERERERKSLAGPAPSTP